MNLNPKEQQSRPISWNTGEHWKRFTSYIPWNPGWLIGILLTAHYIYTPSLHSPSNQRFLIITQVKSMIEHPQMSQVFLSLSSIPFSQSRISSPQKSPSTNRRHDLRGVFTHPGPQPSARSNGRPKDGSLSRRSLCCRDNVGTSCAMCWCQTITICVDDDEGWWWTWTMNDERWWRWKWQNFVKLSKEGGLCPTINPDLQPEFTIWRALLGRFSDPQKIFQNPPKKISYTPKN